MAHEALETISAYLVDNGIADVLEDQARTIAKYLQVGDLPEQDSNALRRCERRAHSNSLFAPSG